MGRLEPAVTRTILVEQWVSKQKEMEGQETRVFTGNCKQERTERMRGKLEGRTLQ